MPRKYIGRVVGPQGPQGPVGPAGEQGAQGPVGPSATINGVPAIEITAGNNIDLVQKNSNLTINALVSSRNLLDNWYFMGGGSQHGDGRFPINQRGKTEYTGLVYGIDRFRGATGVTVQLMDDSLRFSAYGTTGTLQWGQFLDTGLVRALVGRTVTLSALTGDVTGDKIHLMLRFGQSGGAFISSATKTLTAHDVAYTSVTVPENCGDIKANIAVVADDKLPSDYAEIKAMKLELGDVQTLARRENGAWVLNDPPPDYALELTKCQRYYQIFPSVQAIPGGSAPTSSTPIKKEAFRPVMRSDITLAKYGQISIGSETFYYADANE